VLQQWVSVLKAHSKQLMKAQWYTSNSWQYGMKHYGSANPFQKNAL